MKLIMENWRSYREQQLEEACQGSDCLEEYTVKEFLEDVGKKSGLTQKFFQTMDKIANGGQYDNKTQGMAKKLMVYAADKGLGALIGGGIGAALLAWCPPCVIPGAAAGAVIGSVGTDLVKKGLGTLNSGLEKMFKDAQGQDPPEDPRGWILDLNDQVEALAKGGGENSPLFQQFLKELISHFEEVERAITTAIEGLPRDPAQSGLPEEAQGPNPTALNDLMISSIKPYLKTTASQELQNFIAAGAGTIGTDQVVAQHPNIKESK